MTKKLMPKLVSVPPQFMAFLEDRARYGDAQEGLYKGLKWLARRPNRENEVGLLHWNGYVEIPRELTDQEESELDALSHGGITGGSLKMLGFDCAHHRDYQPWNHYTQIQLIKLNSNRAYYPPDPNDIYRDFPYVRSVIERMIDYLSNLPRAKELREVHDLENDSLKDDSLKDDSLKGDSSSTE